MVHAYVLITVLLACACSLRAQQVTGTNEWEVLQGCRLVTNRFLDGDSFHVLHEGRQYIFRLYFVDAPETDASLTNRIQDQAAYFGIAESDVPRAGGLASRFVHDRLAGKGFTVTTRWQNAMGRSSLARFYGQVSVGDKTLDALRPLVRVGPHRSSRAIEEH